MSTGPSAFTKTRISPGHRRCHPNGTYRVIEFTPPGSAASIIFGKGITSARPGSVDRLVLAVTDIDAVRDELLSQGIAVSEVFHDAGGGLGGGFHAGTEGRAPGPDPQRRSYGSMPRSAIPTAMFGGCRRSRAASGLVDSCVGLCRRAGSALRRAEAGGKHEAQLGKRDRTGRPGTPSTCSGAVRRSG